MQIRAYKLDDSEGVKNLILGILSEEYPFDKAAYSDSDINDISGVYGGTGDAFVVLEDKSHNVVGTIGIKKESDNSALVRRLFLDKEHRKKGYGGQLLDAAIEICKKKQYKYLVFRATGRMKAAMELCKKRGFKQEEELDLGGFTIHKLILELK